MDNDKALRRIINLSRVIFTIIMLLLLAALLLHNLWRYYTPKSQAVELQTSVQAIEDTTEDLQENVAELQDTTEELQETIDELQDTPLINPVAEEDLSDIDVRLNEVDEQLETLEEDLEVTTETTTAPSHEIRGGINQIFILVALFVSIMSMLTAFALAVALNTRRKKNRYLVY